MRKLLGILMLFFLFKNSIAQNGLEGLIVEKYYKSNNIDTTVNAIGGKLPVGSVTYRFFLDLLPDYKFQAAYGLAGHELRIETSTLFFNNEDRGDITPSYSKNNAKDNTVMLDSWLSAGAACVGNFGVLKTEDIDSLATVVNAESPQVLQNDAIDCGIPIKTQDGLQVGTPGVFGNIGIDTEIGVFGSQNDGTNGPVFSTYNGSWYCLGGSSGFDAVTNRVLIAQITTNGNLKYKFNLQIGTPTGGIERYVSEALTGDTSSILFPALNDSIMVATAIKELNNVSNDLHVDIYPNPVHAAFVTIKSFNVDWEQTCTISLCNMQGITVRSQMVNHLAKQAIKYNLEGIESGVYLIKITDQNKSITKRIIIINN